MKAKEKILKAADQLFGTVGFDAASTREIAELSGVNKALIHYHFKSKDGLLTELLDNYYKELGSILQKALLSEGDLKDRLVALVDTYMDFLVDNQNFSRIVQREAAGGKHVARIEKHMEPLLELGISTLKQVYPQTQSGAFAAEQIFISFYGAVISYFTYSDLLKRLFKDDPMSKEKLNERKEHLKLLAETLIDKVETK